MGEQLKIGDQRVLARVTRVMFWSAANPGLPKEKISDYIGQLITIEWLMQDRFRVRTSDGLLFCGVHPEDLEDIFISCCQEAING